MRFSLAFLVFPCLLSACASVTTAPVSPLATNVKADPRMPLAASFHAPMPVVSGIANTAKDGTDMRQWWRQFDDPALADLVELALAYSPSLGQAQARIAQARASAGSARAARWPSVDANGRVQRSNAQGPASGNASLSLDASWELDLFGANRNAQHAAQARWQARQLQAESIKVSVAAETAISFINYRNCRGQLAILDEDLSSRQQTWHLSKLKIAAGFTAPADAALAQAALADARQRRAAQELACEMEVKAMQALTGVEESQLRQKLAHNAGQLPKPAAFKVNSIPAQALAQRPDIASAEQDLAASYFDLSSAEAARWPRINLLGSIGVSALSLGGQDSSNRSWSIGPMLSLPFLNAGKTQAEIDSAKARQQEAYESYRQQVIEAVKEIEQALLRLDASGKRADDAALASAEYGKFFTASDAQYQLGSISLLDLEEARRSWLNARQGELNLQYETVLAWLSLYKAVGGGWQATPPTQ